MERFGVAPTAIAGVAVLERRRLSDARGSFCRLYSGDELDALGVGGFEVQQVNHSITSRSGSLRGLHFQRVPHADRKLVHCLRGAAYDVAVDLRRGSPTFGRWHAETISADNGRALLIPEGCAHGFQALVDGTELLYVHGGRYAPAAEGGLYPFDPSLAIPWPLPPADVSDRDRGHPRLDDRFEAL